MGLHAMPDLARFDVGCVAVAVAAWPMRAEEELRSAAIFRAATRAARRLGELEIARTLAAVVRDELRHVRLCTEVGSRLGARAPRHELEPVTRRLDALPDVALRLGAIVLVEAAIGETISSALFRAGQRTATEPLTQHTLTAILRDEARHAQLGWRLSEAIGRASPTLHEPLQLEAQRALGALEHGIAVPAMRWLEAGNAFDADLGALGVLHPAERIEAFYGTVEKLVVPRLSRLGLDGSAAWERRHRAHPTALNSGSEK